MLLGSLFCLLQKLLEGGRWFSLGAGAKELSRERMKETLERSATQMQEENELC